MAATRSIAVAPLVGVAAMTAAVLAVAAWRVNLQAIDTRIDERRSTAKKLLVSKGIPPNDEVMAYLKRRQASFDRAYHQWLERVAVAPSVDAATADPQLSYQERLHEVQRTLERVAAAHKMPVPEQLGLPKELPPSETVPRLLAQLSLLEEAATLIMEQGVTALASLKVEDPETVEAAEGGGTFLTRVPVRVRLSGSLPQVIKVLDGMGRAQPMIDVRTIRLVGSAQAPDRLEVELAVARYLASAPVPEAPDHAG